MNTLHEAILMVLLRQEADSDEKAMTTADISAVINRYHLYSRKDDRQVPASQISARVAKYPILFIRKGHLIHLSDTVEMIKRIVVNSLKSP